MNLLPCSKRLKSADEVRAFQMLSLLFWPVTEEVLPFSSCRIPILDCVDRTMMIAPHAADTILSPLRSVTDSHGLHRYIFHRTYINAFPATYAVIRSVPSRRGYSKFLEQRKYKSALQHRHSSSDIVLLPLLLPYLFRNTGESRISRRQLCMSQFFRIK